MWLLGQFETSRNVAGVVAEKDADGIFLLSDLALEVRDFGCDCINELLGLTHIQHRVDTVLLQSLRQLERVVSRTQGALGDFQLEVQHAKRKIRAREVGDQSGHNFFLSPLVGQQIRPRCFGCAAVSSPEVQIPCCGRRNLALSDLVTRNRSAYRTAASLLREPLRSAATLASASSSFSCVHQNRSGALFASSIQYASCIVSYQQGPDRFRRGRDLALVREMDWGAARSHFLRPFNCFEHTYPQVVVLNF